MPRTYTVELFRYDLMQGMAAQFSQMMLGAHIEAVWHTALHVYGREFYFDGGVGIVAMSPRSTRFGQPVRVDVLGETEIGPEDFQVWNVQQLRSKYGPTDYSLMSRNCNHYTQDATMFLVGRGIGDDIVTMIDRLLSTPLGQMLRPNLELMESGGGGGSGGGGAQPVAIDRQPSRAPSRVSEETKQGETEAILPPATPQAKLQIPLGTHPLSGEAEDELLLALSLLESDDDDRQRQEQAVATLLTIVRNVLDSPTQPKFRRVGVHTAAFQSRLAPLPTSVELLGALGFRRVRDAGLPAGRDVVYELTSASGNAAVLRRAHKALSTLRTQLAARLGKELPLVEWVMWQPGSPLPVNAMCAGSEGNGQLLYIGRERGAGRRAVGKCAVHLGGCNIPSDDGTETHVTNAEVLCARSEDRDKLAWHPIAAFESNDEVLAAAVPIAGGAGAGVCVRGGNGDGVHPGWWPLGCEAAARPVVPYGGGAVAIAGWPTAEVLCVKAKLTAAQVLRGEQLAVGHATLQRHYDDVCAPLRSVEELWRWTPPCTASSRLRPCALRPRPETPEDGAGGRATHPRPYVLACHDFKGGYAKENDAAWFAQLPPAAAAGAAGDSGCAGAPHDDAYVPAYLRRIDILCYFSHCRVTIPPREWIDAAHRSGVRALGTFITEWEIGSAECCRMLATPATIHSTVGQLVALAQHFGFDGWLVNIENDLPSESVAAALVRFVAALTQAMRRALGPERALTIWYDAVTISGRLQWQNALTDENRPFFDAADAIFINYHWSVPLLERTAALAQKANRRLRDIYVGCDVFGRGTFGGGQLRTVDAVSEIHARGLSSALFAPGWTHESGGKCPRERLFNDSMLWGSLDAFCRGYSRVQELPFATNFHSGCGAGYFVGGQRVASNAFVQLGAMQPFADHLSHTHARALGDVADSVLPRTLLVQDDAFNGSQSLEVQLQRPARWSAEPLVLFSSDVLSEPLVICAALKLPYQPTTTADALPWLVLRLLRIDSDSSSSASFMDVMLSQRRNNNDAAAAGTVRRTGGNTEHRLVEVQSRGAATVAAPDCGWFALEWEVPHPRELAAAPDAQWEIYELSILDGCGEAALHPLPVTGEVERGSERRPSAVRVGHLSVFARSHLNDTSSPPAAPAVALTSPAVALRAIDSLRGRHVLLVPGGLGAEALRATAVLESEAAALVFFLDNVFAGGCDAPPLTLFLGRYDVTCLPSCPDATDITIPFSIPSGRTKGIFSAPVLRIVIESKRLLPLASASVSVTNVELTR